MPFKGAVMHTFDNTIQPHKTLNVSGGTQVQMGKKKKKRKRKDFERSLSVAACLIVLISIEY